MRRNLLVLAASIAALAALTLAVVPFRSADTGHPCGAFGGAAWWRVAASRRHEADARQDLSDSQRVLDGLASNPSAGDAAHREEFTEDANDQIRADRETLASIGSCDATANVRIGMALLGAAAAAAAIVGLFAVGRATLRWWRARRPPPTASPADEHCPVCGVLLDDPIGCWNCGAFEDGPTWRRPANAPPLHERQLRDSNRPP